MLLLELSVSYYITIIGLAVNGFCIKIKTIKDEKVFINACHTPDLPQPDDLSEEALQEILQSDARSNYRVPMSIGQVRLELDKQGHPASVYDIAVNSIFLTKLEKSIFFKEFFVTLAIEAIEDKYNLQLNRETVSVLKHKKFMGTLQRHRVQQREVEKVMGIPPKPLIEEISSTAADSVAGSSKVVEPKFTAPPYRLVKEPPTGPLKAIIGEFKLPGVNSVKEFTFDVGEDRIMLMSKLFGWGCDLFLPVNVDQDKTTAAFNKNNQMLIVNMPVLPTTA